jgi:flagellar protein FliO/FliZ
LGGEKLNVKRVFLTAALLAAAGLIFISTSLSAQEQQIGLEQSAPVLPSAEIPTQFPAEVPTQFPAEESIILGEALPSNTNQNPASAWVVVRMVLVLALAALAIYGVVFFVKRLARPPETRDPHLKVLASAPLGGGAFTAVVSVGSKAWLVGGGDAGVSLISEIDEAEALEAMLLDDARKAAEARPVRFLDFRSLLGKLGAGSAPNKSNAHAETLRRQRDRLKGL